MANYSKTQWPITVSMYSHTRGFVGWLEFSRSRQDRLQAVGWVWVSSMHLPYLCNQQATCHAALSWRWKWTERQRWAQIDSTLQPLIGSLLAPHWPKLVTRPNGVAESMSCGFVSISLLLLTYVSAVRQKPHASLCFLSYSVKWDNNSYIAGRL